MNEFQIHWEVNPNPFCWTNLNKVWFLRCEEGGDGDIMRIRGVELCKTPSKVDENSSNFDNNVDEFLVSGELHFTTSSDKTFKREFSQLIKTKRGKYFEGYLVGGISYLVRRDKWGCLIQGVVRIADVTPKSATGSANREFKERIQLKSLEQLTNDFEKLLDPNLSRLADITLKCGGVSIPAHKAILSARSPVFAAMFANPMRESRKNELNFIDIDVAILRALLMYVYTGKTPDLTASSAKDLLFAADKYKLQDLKTMCSCFLIDTMSLQNVLQTLDLGDLLDEDLKSFAMDYICNKCADFSVLEKMEEWDALQREKPTLAMAVLTSLVKYREEKLK